MKSVRAVLPADNEGRVDRGFQRAAERVLIYLRGITQGILFSRATDMGRSVGRAVFLHEDIFEVLNVCEKGADDRLMKTQSHDKVRLMLDALPSEQREVIVLRHYADLSFKEIAEMTNCSINTALGRMRYGLINMRRMVSENQIAL